MGTFGIRKNLEIPRQNFYRVYIPPDVRETLKPKLTAMLPFADEEVYSAEFVYESIYEEIPAEVSEVKVKPFPALAPLTRTPQTTRTGMGVHSAIQ